MSSEKKRDVFFCPFKEVEIQNLYSEMLEKIGGLPMLILLQAAENKTRAQKPAYRQNACGPCPQSGFGICDRIFTLYIGN